MWSVPYLLQHLIKIGQNSSSWYRVASFLSDAQLNCSQALAYHLNRTTFLSIFQEDTERFNIHCNCRPNLLMKQAPKCFLRFLLIKHIAFFWMIFQGEDHLPCGLPVWKKRFWPPAKSPIRNVDLLKKISLFRFSMIVCCINRLSISLSLLLLAE